MLAKKVKKSIQKFEAKAINVKAQTKVKGGNNSSQNGGIIEGIMPIQ